jgi:hypothetical protein
VLRGLPPNVRSSSSITVAIIHGWPPRSISRAEGSAMCRLGTSRYGCADLSLLVTWGDILRVCDDGPALELVLESGEAGGESRYPPDMKEGTRRTPLV